MVDQPVIKILTTQVSVSSRGLYLEEGALINGIFIFLFQIFVKIATFFFSFSIVVQPNQGVQQKDRLF